MSQIKRNNVPQFIKWLQTPHSEKDIISGKEDDVKYIIKKCELLKTEHTLYTEKCEGMKTKAQTYLKQLQTFLEQQRRYSRNEWPIPDVEPPTLFRGSTSFAQIGQELGDYTSYNNKVKRGCLKLNNKKLNNKIKITGDNNEDNKKIDELKSEIDKLKSEIDDIVKKLMNANSATNPLKF